MKRISLFLAAALVQSFLFTACGNAAAPKPDTDSAAKAGTANESTAVATIKFEIVQSENKETGNPSSAISVNYNGKSTAIETITGNAAELSRAEFAEKEIPAGAIAACGAWWAGAGDYFYLIQSGNGIAVFKGWQDEGQTDAGFHWEKLKDIAGE